MTVEKPKLASTGAPSMFRAAVEAAAAALPDAPMATVEQVALAVLRVALPLHETQHADAWKAAHERAVHFELEAVKAAERAERAEAEVRRYRSFCGEAHCGDIERDRDEYQRQNEQLRGELERYRGLDAAAKELLARNVELGTRADNSVARCEDLEDELERLRAQLAEATTLLGHFVDHEDQPCRLDHHGACQEHGGSSLRPCDVAAGREWLARVREDGVEAGTFAHLGAKEE